MQSVDNGGAPNARSWTVRRNSTILANLRMHFSYIFSQGRTILRTQLLRGLVSIALPYCFQL